MWLNPFIDGCQCGYITKLKKKIDWLHPTHWELSNGFVMAIRI
jgi:hypothetical protein